jgi:hypothetical protein
MTSEPEQDWHTLFRQRRELTGARDKALQRLNVIDMYIDEGISTDDDGVPIDDSLPDAIEQAVQTCNAVTAFDRTHPYMVGEDEQYENAEARRFMAEFRHHR